MENKDYIIHSLLLRVEELEKKLSDLAQENASLKSDLDKYKNKKNSNNSSMAPSMDMNRPNKKSLRQSTGRKPGGQKGRKGKTLEMAAVPDLVVDHVPQYCNCCGKNINPGHLEERGKRQIIDIKKIEIEVTEHRVFGYKCNCGHKTTADYPQGVNAPVSYGAKAQCLAAYLHTRQYVPFKRIQELFNDVFGLPISEGGIHCLLDKVVKKTVPAYMLIKQRLLSGGQKAIGTDETGIKVAGQKHWAWTWQSNDATFISITDNRGMQSIKDNFENGFDGSVLVHDCWKSHFNTPALSHQICIAHLLRELNYLTELYGHKWSKVCKKILLTSLALKADMSTPDYYGHNLIRAKIEKRLDRLLQYQLPGDFKEMVPFQKRLIKYRQYIFTFLYQPFVPPDNNASERAIRNIKVKQKVSGQFRSTYGAYGFSVLRSVVDTIIKNKGNVINSLMEIVNLETD